MVINHLIECHQCNCLKKQPRTKICFFSMKKIKQTFLCNFTSVNVAHSIICSASGNETEGNLRRYSLWIAGFTFESLET